MSFNWVKDRCKIEKICILFFKLSLRASIKIEKGISRTREKLEKEFFYIYFVVVVPKMLTTIFFAG